MEEYNISGYGVDLDKLYTVTPLTDNETNLYTAICENDNFLDAIDFLQTYVTPENHENMSVISAATPCNTDAFTCFINLPDISQVIDNPGQVTLYSKDTAIYLIQTYIGELFRYIYKNGTFKQDKKTLNSLIIKLQQAVPDQAGHEDFQDVC